MPWDGTQQHTSPDLLSPVFSQPSLTKKKSLTTNDKWAKFEQHSSQGEAGTDHSMKRPDPVGARGAGEVSGRDPRLTQQPACVENPAVPSLRETAPSRSDTTTAHDMRAIDHEPQH